MITGGQDRHREPTGLRGVLERHEYTAVDHHAGAASIPGLLLRGCPATVSRSVVPGSVRISVNGVLIRRLTAHVLEKSLEGRGPAVAYRYALPAIVGITPVARIVATTEHLAPRPILRRLATHASITVDERTSRRLLSSEAAAGPRVAAPQVVADHHEFVPAVAHRFPIRTAVLGPIDGCHAETTEALS